MAPTHSSASSQPAQESAKETLIQRGQLFLHILHKEAHAARIEAQLAELQVAIESARAGQTKLLADWLEEHQSSDIAHHIRWDSAEILATSDSVPVAWCHLAADVAAVEVQEVPKPSSSDQELSWDQILPHAQRRLHKQREALRSTNANAPLPVTTTSSQGHLTTARLDNRQPNPQLRPPVARELLANLAQSRELPQPGLLNRMGAAGLSFIAHVVFVLLLGLFTIKLPSTVASLSFESTAVENAAASFELTSPTETLDELEPTLEESPAAEPMAVELSTDLTTPVATVNVATNSPGLDLASAIANSSSNKPAQGKGPMKATASFFGAGAGGNNFCYVIDASESMRGLAWESAKAELIRSIQSMKEHQRFYVIFFSKELEAITLPGEQTPAIQLLYATPQNIRHAVTWIETLRVSPGSPPNEALKLAIDREPDAIYLLTDGVTTVDVAGFLRKVNRISDLITGEQVRVPIHAIAYHSLSGEQLMRRVASENNGQFIYVPKPSKR